MIDTRDIKEFLRDIWGLIVTAVTVLIIIIYVVSVQQVVGPSMDPTLKNGDILLLNKMTYRIFDIKRFDVVSISNDSSKYLVKRIIGLPGENIEYKDNLLYINGKGYKEKFLANDVTTENFSLKDLGYNKIPKDMYLVLGDNRTNSEDSRNPKIGLIKKDQILGKTTIKIWPFTDFGFVK